MPVFLSLVLLFAAFQDQDESIRKNLESLSSDDVSERDRALAELKKTSLDRLKLLEPGLESKDPEYQSRVREAMSGALREALGTHLVRFCAKAVAPEEVMEQWAKTGYDAAKVPEGFERIPSHDRFKERADAPYLKGEHILVEKVAVITNEHVHSTDARQMFEIGGQTWVTSFELTEEGAKRFDEAARRLYKQKPNPGILALFVDGEIVMAPAVRSASFGGHGQISGAKTREECERTAALLRGRWFAISFRVVRESGNAVTADEVSRLLRKLPGFEQVECTPGGDGHISVKGPLDTRAQNFLNLWSSLRQEGYRLLPRQAEGSSPPRR